MAPINLSKSPVSQGEGNVRMQRSIDRTSHLVPGGEPKVTTGIPELVASVASLRCGPRVDKLRLMGFTSPGKSRPPRPRARPIRDVNLIKFLPP